jgi:hypothetical protein
VIRHEENFRDWAQPRLGLPDVFIQRDGSAHNQENDLYD